METSEPAAGRRPSTNDLKAGLIVFLIALPLCLGIAAASGAPPLSGLLAGMVGGVLVPFLSRASLSVSGPAASSILIVAAAIHQLGFRGMLAATMLSGAIQVSLGLMRVGRVVQIVPNAVIRGMLTAIGLILILKQLPYTLGYNQDYLGNFTFGDVSGRNTLTEMFAAFTSPHLGPVMVALSAALMLWLWRDFGAVKLEALAPRELVALLVGTAVAGGLANTPYALASEHLISIPNLTARGLTELWATPDLSQLGQIELWKAALTLALVSSVQSLLSIEATDRLDPYHRMSPPNRELWAQGIGNLTSGALGGLPVTSVILRSSANVQAGAQTRWAAITHGMLLGFATLLLAPLLSRIPLSALAVLLISVGYKLTPPRVYRDVRALGTAQFVPFLMTIACILLTDLLLGVLLGTAFSIFFVLYRDYASSVVITDDDGARMVRFKSSASFFHKPALKGAIETAPRGGLIIIDLTRVRSVDPDILETIRELEQHAGSLGVRISVERSRSAFHPYFREGDDP